MASDAVCNMVNSKLNYLALVKTSYFIGGFN
jgi:hypothetical protein